MRGAPREFKVSLVSIMSGSFHVSKPAFGGFLRLLCFLLAVIFVSGEECNKEQCKGPLRYYEELRCKPIYEKPGDCCAIKYDCSHLGGRSKDKCYVNNSEYEVGDQLKKEDRSSACDIGCTCVKGFNDVATFRCAIVDCFHGMPKPGCYLKRDIDSCCPSEVCPENPENIIKCEVEGKTYMDGQAFYPSGSPELVCQCAEGYKGENVQPFCKNIKCGVELRHSWEIRENCVPVFYSSQPPSTSCSLSHRCQNDNDTVIHSESEKSSEVKPDKPDSKESAENKSSDETTCKFGNMTMHIGDELNQATDYSSVCVQCKCEVPPLPTCQRLPDDQCDVTKHPQF